MNTVYWIGPFTHESEAKKGELASKHGIADRDGAALATVQDLDGYLGAGFPNVSSDWLMLSDIDQFPLRTDVSLPRRWLCNGRRHLRDCRDR
jgi:hypothetical protein